MMQGNVASHQLNSSEAVKSIAQQSVVTSHTLELWENVDMDMM